MSSYEERVVDRGVDRAWMQLRLRLADLLTSATIDAPVAISLTPLAAGEEPPAVIIEADGTDLAVRIDLAGGLDAPFRFDVSERSRLAALGMRIEDGGPVLLLEADEVDRAAHYVYAILHEMWDVVHPSFLAIDPEDLGLVDEPPSVEARPVELPDMVRPASLESLNEWVDATLEPEFGHTPYRDDDGDICVNGQHDATAIVRVRSQNRIEVWTIVAHEVNRKKARREVDRLSRHYSFHRFFVVDDMLVASIVLFADPFVPAQLVKAAAGHAVRQPAAPQPRQEARDSLRRRATSGNSMPDLDPRLMSLFVSARRMQTAELVETAVNLADGSESTLQAWRAHSIAAQAEATRLFREQGDVNYVHRRSLSSWRRVIRALDLALAEVTAGSQDAA